MAATASFHGRKAVQFENDELRVTLTEEGGHIAEICDKASGVSPLWVPPWKSIEPSSYSPRAHPEYGLNSESKLLAGIMGHNLCLDFFGPPSEAEARSGLTVHGEASVARYEFRSSVDEVVAQCDLPAAQLSFTRRLRLRGRRLSVSETVENRSSYDRSIAWQQHVTLGPPFLEYGKTHVEAPIAKTDSEGRSGYTAQLLKQENERSWFFAFAPSSELLLGYVWRTADFPWLGRWEENRGRQSAPWNGRTVTLGLEFGTTPFPETRREMIDRGRFFDTPAYRWIEAGSRLTVEYYAALLPATTMPATLEAFEELI